MALSMLGTSVFLASIFAIGYWTLTIQAEVASYDLRKEISVTRNPAVLIRTCGFIAALFIGTVGAYHPDATITGSATSGAIAIVAAIVALTIAHYVNDYAILHEVRNDEAIVRDKNIAVAMVECSTSVATAYILMSRTHSPGDGWMYAFVWFAIGQMLLFALVRGYALIEKRTFTKVVEGNVACALALSGLILSGGIMVGTAIDGDSNGFLNDCLLVLKAVISWTIFVVPLWLVISYALTKDSSTSMELCVNENWGYGLLSGVLLLGLTAAFASIHGN